MKVTVAVTESSIDADDERTCFTQTPRVSGRTLAGEAVDQVCARASVLARMWGTFIDVYGGKTKWVVLCFILCLFKSFLSLCQGRQRGKKKSVDSNSLIWHLRPLKPAKHEQVKEGLPVMQSSMHWPPFRQGRRWGHTDAAERGRSYRESAMKECIWTTRMFQPGMARANTQDRYWFWIEHRAKTL